MLVDDEAAFEAERLEAELVGGGSSGHNDRLIWVLDPGGRFTIVALHKWKALRILTDATLHGLPYLRDPAQGFGHKFRLLNKKKEILSLALTLSGSEGLVHLKLPMILARRQILTSSAFVFFHIHHQNIQPLLERDIIKISDIPHTHPPGCPFSSLTATSRSNPQARDTAHQSTAHGVYRSHRLRRSQSACL